MSTWSGVQLQNGKKKQEDFPNKSEPPVNWETFEHLIFPEPII